jgi:hypothetical protein
MSGQSKNFIAAVTLIASACAQTPAEIRAIAEKAYIYAYPMVLMEYTRRNTPVPNRFLNAQQFPDSKFRNVIRPNADTLYSSAWLDLSKEPVMLHVPDTQDRYYLMQFMDAWTDTFSIPGKRTTGTNEQWFAITGPGWTGDLPKSAKRIESPTNMVWLLGRTQTNGSEDYQNVHAIQSGYKLMLLSRYPDGPGTSAPMPLGRPQGEIPPVKVQKLSKQEFFETFCALLPANPPHKGDEAIMADLARIGIRPGKFEPVSMAEIEAGANAASKRLETSGDSVGRPGPTGWTGGGGQVGRYGTNYNQRAIVARIGLGANPPEDAVYMHTHVDSEGKPLDARSRYRIHFDKTPPVKAFWSLTMYSQDGYFVANPINRFAIGDRDKLKFNSDGSLDLYIQHDSPGADKVSNWLPAAEGEFNLSLRLYWPSDEILGGKWIPPAVVHQ